MRLEQDQPQSRSEPKPTSSNTWFVCGDISLKRRNLRANVDQQILRVASGVMGLRIHHLLYRFQALQLFRENMQ